MKKLFTLTTLVALAITWQAHAGKAERDKQTEVTAAIKTTSAEYKKNCGCDLKVDVKWDQFKAADHMSQIKNSMDSIASESKNYCNDDGSKKAMCAMKSLEITKGAETKFSFNSGKGKLETDGNSYVHWDMISREVDK